MAAQRQASSFRPVMIEAFAAAGVAAVFGAGAPAAAAAEQAADAFVVEEIIVTARKRDERLSDVPAGVSALTGDMLEKTAVAGLADYARVLPGVAFFDGGSPQQNRVVMRGITDSLIPTGSQATVSIYLDEAPLTTSALAQNPDIYVNDLEQLTVLRGPQGTLFGAGSLGGTVRLITRKPDFEELSGHVEARLSDTREGGLNYDAGGVLNVPLVADRLALRASAYRNERSGFIDNARIGGEDVNDVTTSGGRLALALKASDTLLITASGYVQQRDIGASGFYNRAGNDLTSTAFFPEPASDDLYVAALTAQADLGFAQLISASSYYHREAATDTDFSAFAAAFQPIFGFAPRLLISGPTDTSLFAQELRLVSTGEGPLTWLVGGFFSRDETTSVQFGASPDLTFLAQAPDASNALYYSRSNAEWTQKAVFADVSYALSEQWSIGAGLRFFDIDGETARRLNGLVNGLAALRVDPPLDAADDGLTPKLTLSYKPAEDVLVYALYSRGYRVGGTNVTLPPDVDGRTTPGQFGSDTLANYELGVKSQFADGRMALNLTGFFVDWSDIQSTQTRLDGRRYTTNAGNADSYGVELESVFTPTQAWYVSFGGTYNHTELKTDQPALQASKGDRLPGTPEWMLNFAAEYRFDLPVLAAHSFVRLESQYIGDYKSNFDSVVAPPVATLGDYALTNVRWSVDIDAYSVSLFIENVADERPFVAADPTLTGSLVTTLRPRTIGASLRYAF